MTAKERTEMMIDQFQKAIWKNGNPNHIHAHAKECAILCVDEIIEALGPLELYWLNDVIDPVKLYQEVKQELQNL